MEKFAKLYDTPRGQVLVVDACPGTGWCDVTTLEYGTVRTVRTYCRFEDFDYNTAVQYISFGNPG